MKNKIFCLIIVLGIILYGISLYAKSSSDDSVLLGKTTKDLKDWLYNNNKDGKPGCIIKKSKGLTVVQGNDKDQNFSAVYKKISLDLDQYSFLEMDVKSVSDHWYCILKAEGLQDGFLRLQPDTAKTGKFRFNIRKAIGRGGVQHFSLEIGVSSPEGKSTKGKKVVIKKAVFLNTGLKKAKGKMKDVSSYDLINKNYNNIGFWQLGHMDSREVEIKVKDRKTIITGKMDNQNFGAARKNVTLDLNKYSFIEIEVADVSDHWYLIMSGNSIPNGYIKLQPDSNKKGVFEYNIKEKLKISGTIDFDLQIGVSSPEGKNCLGQKVVVKKLHILSK